MIQRFLRIKVAKSSVVVSETGNFCSRANRFKQIAQLIPGK